MSSSDKRRIRVGARKSLLSQAQVNEVLQELLTYHPNVEFEPVWVETSGDLDQKTSLKTLGKTDFFTKEIDQRLLDGEVSIAIHSAKDLPDPLPEGLSRVALTQGLDPSDSLVLRDGERLEALEMSARIGTSSVRREAVIQTLRSDLLCVDIRGPIAKRLALLDQGHVDGVVIAEAALIRLGLINRNRIILKGESAPLQGQLAVLARLGDKEMSELFSWGRE